MEYDLVRTVALSVSIIFLHYQLINYVYTRPFEFATSCGSSTFFLYLRVAGKKMRFMPKTWVHLATRSYSCTATYKTDNLHEKRKKDLLMTATYSPRADFKFG